MLAVAAGVAISISFDLSVLPAILLTGGLAAILLAPVLALEVQKSYKSDRERD